MNVVNLTIFIRNNHLSCWFVIIIKISKEPHEIIIIKKKKNKTPQEKEKNVEADFAYQTNNIFGPSVRQIWMQYHFESSEEIDIFDKKVFYL